MKFTVLSFLFLLMIYSCNQDSCVDIDCTDHIEIITVQVVDTQNSPVTLDSILVTNHVVLLDYTEELSQFQDSEEFGTYAIASDLQAASIDDFGSDITLLGWLEGKLVVDEVFLVGQDCCHVTMIEGNETIQLDI